MYYYTNISNERQIRNLRNMRLIDLSVWSGKIMEDKICIYPLIRFNNVRNIPNFICFSVKDNTAYGCHTGYLRLGTDNTVNLFGEVFTYDNDQHCLYTNNVDLYDKLSALITFDCDTMLVKSASFK